MPSSLTYRPFGERAILIEWPAKIAPEIVQDIIRFRAKIMAVTEAGIEDCIIGYNSLTVLYVEEIPSFERAYEGLKDIYSQEDLPIQAKSVRWEIPVCYDPVFGIDLEEMSKSLQRSTASIIDLHTQAVYTVYFIGFLPGFLYLGGLDHRLTMPRRAAPRLQVAKGAVAIGGAQTGIYPMESAGGWNIIGQSPISFFDLSRQMPCFAQAGDQIQFIPITLQAYEELEVAIASGNYEPVKYLLHD